MKVTDIPELANLSVPEKILLVEDIWDSIAADESQVPVPEAHKQELDLRLAKQKDNVRQLQSLDELREHVSRRISS